MRITLTRIVAATAAAIIGSLAAFVVAASPAAAHCQGQGQGSYLATYLNGHHVAWERQVRGTCDGDGIYNGQLMDPYNDGYAARVRYEDGSFAGIVKYAYSSTWVNYRFYDQTGNSSAIIELYASPASRPLHPPLNYGF